MSELTNFDAVDQAALVASGKVSARELIDAAIAQAEAVNGDINAIIHPRFERAQKEADEGLPSGPFTGVPMVLKDLGAPLAGEPHHQGTRFFRNVQCQDDPEFLKLCLLRLFEPNLIQVWGFA